MDDEVDAAALAGATKFVGCSFQFGNPLAANQAIKATALTYTGDMNRDPATSNLQLQEPIKVHAVLNGARYWDEGDPVDDPTLATTLDNTFDPDGDPATPGTPCEMTCQWSEYACVAVLVLTFSSGAYVAAAATY